MPFVGVDEGHARVLIAADRNESVNGITFAVSVGIKVPCYPLGLVLSSSSSYESLEKRDVAGVEPTGAQKREEMADDVVAHGDTQTAVRR